MRRFAVLLTVLAVVVVVGGVAFARSRSSASTTAAPTEASEPDAGGEGEGLRPAATRTLRRRTTSARPVSATVRSIRAPWRRPDGPARSSSRRGHVGAHVAADPSAPYVYAMYNRFGGPKCKQCPASRCTCASRATTASAGGRSYLCAVPGREVAVRPGLQGASRRRAPYATFMNGNDHDVQQVDEPRGHMEHADRGLRPAVGGQAVDRREPQRHRRLHRLRDFSRRVGRRPPTTGGPRSPRPSSSTPTPGATGTRTAWRSCRTARPSSRPRVSGLPEAARSGQHRDLEDDERRDVVDRTIAATIGPFTGVSWETSSTTALASDAAGTLVALYTGAVARGNGHVWTQRRPIGATWGAPIELDNGAATPASRRSPAERPACSAWTTRTTARAPGTPTTDPRPMAG